MAITCTLSNHWRYQVGAKAVDIQNDTFKAILVNTTFAFDKDAHATLADVIASSSPELATGNGYTQQNKALTGGTWTEDDANDKGIRTFDNITWTASGGSIGPTGALVIYDDTTADDTVVGCVDFGDDYTIPDGTNLQITAPAISI
jgi:hypothetical protein